LSATATKVAVIAPGVPSAGGRPYSPALRCGNFVFVSGQVPIDRDGRTVGQGDVVAQGRQALENVRALVEAAGGALDDVCFLSIYVTDIRNYTPFGELRREYFREPFPASTVIGVTGLAEPDWLIEIEAIAYVPESARQRGT
jgi:reactive intermediate/imine deaminase